MVWVVNGLCVILTPICTNHLLFFCLYTNIWLYFKFNILNLLQSHLKALTPSLFVKPKEHTLGLHFATKQQKKKLPWYHVTNLGCTIHFGHLGLRSLSIKFIFFWTIPTIGSNRSLWMKVVKAKMLCLSFLCSTFVAYC
jgi:hypothetical protein